MTAPTTDDTTLVAELALGMIDVFAGRPPALGRVVLRLHTGAYWVRSGAQPEIGAAPPTVLAALGAASLARRFATVVVVVLPDDAAHGGLTEADFYAPRGVATPSRQFDCLLADQTKPGMRGIRLPHGGWAVVAVAPRVVRDLPAAVARTDREFGDEADERFADCDTGRPAVTCAGRVMAASAALGGRCTDLAVGAYIVRGTSVPETPEAVVLNHTGSSALPPWQLETLRQWGFVSAARPGRQPAAAWANWPRALPTRAVRRGRHEPQGPGDARMRFVREVMDRDIAALVGALEPHRQRAVRQELERVLDEAMATSCNGATIVLDPQAAADEYATPVNPGALSASFGFTVHAPALFRSVWLPEGPGRFPTEPLSRLLVRGCATGCFDGHSWTESLAALGPAPLLMACLAFDRPAGGAHTPLPWLFGGFWAGLGCPAFACVRGQGDLRDAVRGLLRAVAMTPIPAPVSECCAWENAATDAALSPYQKLAANHEPPFVFDTGALAVTPNKGGPLVLGTAFPAAFAEGELVRVKLAAITPLPAEDGFIMDTRTVDRRSYVVVRKGRRPVAVRPLLEMLGEFEVPWIAAALDRDVVLVLGEGDIDHRARHFYAHARFSEPGRRRVWRWLTQGGVLHRCLARRLAQAPVGAPVAALHAFRWRDAGCALAVDTPKDHLVSPEAYFLFAPVVVYGPGGEALCTTVNAALVQWTARAGGAAAADGMLRLGTPVPAGARGALSDEAKAVMFASLSGCRGGAGAAAPRGGPDANLLHGKGTDRAVLGKSLLGTLVASLVGLLPEGTMKHTCAYHLRAYPGDGPALFASHGGRHVIRVAAGRAHDRDSRGLLHPDGPIPFCVWAMTVAGRDRFITSQDISDELDEVRQLWAAVLGDPGIRNNTNLRLP